MKRKRKFRERLKQDLKDPDIRKAFEAEDIFASAILLKDIESARRELRAGKLLSRK